MATYMTPLELQLGRNDEKSLYRIRDHGLRTCELFNQHTFPYQDIPTPAFSCSLIPHSPRERDRHAYRLEQEAFWAMRPGPNPYRFQELFAAPEMVQHRAVVVVLWRAVSLTAVWVFVDVLRRRWGDFVGIVLSRFREVWKTINVRIRLLMISESWLAVSKAAFDAFSWFSLAMLAMASQLVNLIPGIETPARRVIEEQDRALYSIYIPS